LSTIIDGPDELTGEQLLWHDDGQVEGSLGPGLEGEVAALARAALAAGHSQRVELESARGALTLFIDVVLPPLTLLAIGGGHVTVALTRLAAVLGYRTVVLDPRRAFASAERFPHVDRLVSRLAPAGAARDAHHAHDGRRPAEPRSQD
jgi:xanthine dehydrogenase accessory factor